MIIVSTGQFCKVLLSVLGCKLRVHQAETLHLSAFSIWGGAGSPGRGEGAGRRGGDGRGCSSPRRCQRVRCGLGDGVGMWKRDKVGSGQIN